MTDQVTFREIHEDSAPQWLALQKEAFAPLLAKYQDYDTNPACETLERQIERFHESCIRHWLIIADRQPVGGFRVYQYPEKSRLRLSIIFLIPSEQGHGIGEKAARFAEEQFPYARSWELNTILQEPRLLKFYENLGYRQTEDSRTVNAAMTLVGMRKNL